MSIKDGNMTLPTKFMASTDNYEEANIVLVGVHGFYMQLQTRNKVWTPKIREVSIGIEEYSIYMDRDLTEFSFYDAGIGSSHR